MIGFAGSLRNTIVGLIAVCAGAVDAEQLKVPHVITEVHRRFADPRTGRKVPMPSSRAELLAGATRIRDAYCLPRAWLSKPEVFFGAEILITVNFPTDAQARRFFELVVNSEKPFVFAYDWLSPYLNATGPGARQIEARALFYWDQSANRLRPISTLR